jgi:hypothetical protein
MFFFQYGKKHKKWMDDCTHKKNKDSWYGLRPDNFGKVLH